MIDGCVVSDLHIFSKRAQINLMMPRFKEKLKHSRFCVLNGDIFDFKWSTFNSSQETIDAAIKWLDVFLQAYPACQFHYVIGNHDAFDKFVFELNKLAKENNNFNVHLTHLRLGESLFFHGDLQLAGKNPYQRKLERKINIQGEAMNFAYSRVVKFSLHRVADILYAKKRAVNLIIKSFRQFPCEDLEGVSHIYFGHTHVPFEDYEYAGYTFHNTGSAIQGVKCNLLSANTIK